MSLNKVAHSNEDETNNNTYDNNYDDLNSIDIHNEGTNAYKTMSSTIYVEQRRQLKANIVAELLLAVNIQHLDLNKYIIGRKEKRSGGFQRILKLLGLAELTCQEAVLDGSATELNHLMKKLTRNSIFAKKNPRRDEINYYDENGYTALSLAVKSKRFDLVVILVEHKVMLDIFDEKTGMTPLMYSIHNKTHEISNLLIKEGADVNIQDFKCVSSLMIACCMNDALMTMNLCANLAHVDQQDSNGWTPLHYAAFGCSFECCRILISYGADRNKVDYRQRKAIHIAKFKDKVVGRCIAVLEETREILTFDPENSSLT